MEAGSLQGLTIVAPDIEAARAAPIEKGVDVTEVVEPSTRKAGRCTAR
jgi:hypothetical protein